MKSWFHLHHSFTQHYFRANKAKRFFSRKKKKKNEYEHRVHRSNSNDLTTTSNTLKTMNQRYRKKTSFSQNTLPNTKLCTIIGSEDDNETTTKKKKEKERFIKSQIKFTTRKDFLWNKGILYEQVPLLPLIFIQNSISSFQRRPFDQTFTYTYWVTQDWERER